MDQPSINQIGIAGSAFTALHESPEAGVYGPLAWDQFFAEISGRPEAATAQAPAEQPAAFSVGPDCLQPDLDLWE